MYAKTCELCHQVPTKQWSQNFFEVQIGFYWPKIITWSKSNDGVTPIIFQTSNLIKCDIIKTKDFGFIMWLPDPWSLLWALKILNSMSHSDKNFFRTAYVFASSLDFWYLSSIGVGVLCYTRQKTRSVQDCGFNHSFTKKHFVSIITTELRANKVKNSYYNKNKDGNKKHTSFI